MRGLAVKGLERVKIADMAAAFEKYGTVTNVKFMDDRNADAIVEFQRIGEAAEAVSHLHGTKLKNRTIEVQLGDKFMPNPRQRAAGSLPPGVASKPASNGNSGGGGRSTPALSAVSNSADSSRDRSRSDKVKQEPRKVKEERVGRRRPPVKEERPPAAKASKQNVNAKTKSVQAAPKRQQVVESESEQEEDESLSDESDNDDDDVDDSQDDEMELEEQTVRLPLHYSRC